MPKAKHKKIKLRIKDPFPLWVGKTFGDKQVYSVKEISSALKVHPQTVYRAIKFGELEAFILGKQTYIIPRPALEEWLRRLPVEKKERFGIPFA